MDATRRRVRALRGPRGRWLPLAVATLVACSPATDEAGATAAGGAGGPAVDTAGPQPELVLPVYSDRGLVALTSTLRPFVSARTTLMIVSGNEEPTYDPAWVGAAVATLAEAFPASRVVVATSGRAHVERAASTVAPPVAAVVYIYEPNASNETEFSWDFAATRANFDEARDGVSRHGVALFGKPTGRPLLERGLGGFGWDYGALAAGLVELFVQTQTYCRQGTDEFAAAVGSLVRQLDPGTGPRVFVQVSVGPGFPNGVAAPRAVDCLEAARRHLVSGSLAGVLLWWSPEHPGEAARVLERLAAWEGRR